MVIQTKFDPEGVVYSQQLNFYKYTTTTWSLDLAVVETQHLASQRSHSDLRSPLQRRGIQKCRGRPMCL